MTDSGTAITGDSKRSAQGKHLQENGDRIAASSQLQDMLRFKFGGDFFLTIRDTIVRAHIWPGIYPVYELPDTREGYAVTLFNGLFSRPSDRTVDKFRRVAVFSIGYQEPTQENGPVVLEIMSIKNSSKIYEMKGSMVEEDLRLWQIKELGSSHTILQTALAKPDYRTYYDYGLNPVHWINKDGTMVATDLIEDLSMPMTRLNVEPYIPPEIDLLVCAWCASVRYSMREETNEPDITRRRRLDFLTSRMQNYAGESFNIEKIEEDLGGNTALEHSMKSGGKDKGKKQGVKSMLGIKR
jgi:hypothetical protein